MSDIPTEVFHEILSYVPAVTLFRFRSVCKAWRSIIDNPGFARLHLNRQINGEELIIRNDTGKLYSVSLSSIHYSRPRDQDLDFFFIRAVNIKNPIRRGLARIHSLPVQSCYGLILISDVGARKIWALWNPFTGDLLELPPCDNFNSERRICGLHGGLGYDSVTDDYKVVRIGYNFHSDILETIIYSLKSGEWKKIADLSNLQGPLVGDPGVFVNGSLHWITYTREREIKDTRILAFDMTTEKYRWMATPKVFPISGPNLQYKHLDVLGGHLFLSCYSLQGRFDVWLMKDYGGDNMWSKLFSLDDQFSSGYMVNLRPVAYMKSKHEVLIQYNCYMFFWYDIEKKQRKNFGIKDIEGLSSQAFAPSLIRLNGSDGADENNASKETPKRKRKRKSTTDRLELDIRYYCDDLF